MAAASSSRYRKCNYYNCHKSAFVEPSTGIQHDYCGRTHARLALEAQGQNLQPPHGICHLCQLPGCDEPVYYDEEEDRVHDFCCLAHAYQAQDMGMWPLSNRSIQRHSDPSDRCSLPGCSAPRYVDGRTGQVHDFCGRTHAKQAAARGLLSASEAGVPSHWVDRVFSGRAGEPKYTISMLTNHHERYQGIKEQFLRSWTHPGPQPRVLRIYQVRNPREVYERYLQYREFLERHGGANEKRRFHGTSMAPECMFGHDVNRGPCMNPNCAVCTICETSFDLRHAGNSVRGGGARMALRYGNGLYFSRVSSKSNDYANDSERDGVRIVFLCKICLGNTYCAQEELIHTDQVNSLIRCRTGSATFDSITGLTIAEGGKLNYQENVIYCNDAAIPSYLVVYKVS
eukprot:270302-Hanusia_phi.AAC.2